MLSRTARRRANAGRPDGTRRATYGEVFAVPEFRALWSAHAFSLIGDQLAQVALAVLVYTRTSSALLTGVVYALTYLPPLLGGPLLAGLADVLPRRRLMIICDLVRAVLIAAVALPGMPFPALCVLIFVVVLIGSPFTAAKAAVLPDVLPGDRFVVGSAINNITTQACQMVGFVAGGAIVAFIGTHLALAADAVTFLLSAAILALWVHRRPATREGGGGGTSLWAGTKGGVRLVFGDQRLRALVLFAWLCLFVIAPEGLAAPYAASLDAGGLVVGILMASAPTGMAIGGFIFTRLVQPQRRIMVMGWMAMLSLAPLIGCATEPPLAIVVALWFVCGLGSSYQLAANAAFVQTVPNEGRGQAFGLVTSGMQVFQGIGIILAGAVAEVLDPAAAIALFGAVGLAAASILAVQWLHIRGGIVAAMRGEPAERTD